MNFSNKLEVWRSCILTRQAHCASEERTQPVDDKPGKPTSGGVYQNSQNDHTAGAWEIQAIKHGK